MCQDKVHSTGSLVEAPESQVTCRRADLAALLDVFFDGG